jgi:hypothetical protein
MAIQGFCVAFNDDTFTAAPTWTQLDVSPYRTTGVTIDRGRNYEFDRTEAGSATVTMVDTTGALDPTNPSGPWFGKLVPLKQAAYALYDPFVGAYSTIFRGFISDIQYSVDATERFNTVTFHLVDALAIFGATELVPNGAFGDTLPAEAAGDVFYADDSGTDAVRTRLVQVLDEIGWPGTGLAIGTLREIFSGNVKLSGGNSTVGGIVYSFGTPALTVMQDAADAEFPGVANLWVAKDGTVTFHGRFARFNPTNASYHIHPWHVGDTAAVVADFTTVQVVEPLEFMIDMEHLWTVGICTPQGIDDGDIASQYVSNHPEAVAKYGIRTWSAENILNGGGAGTTASEECQRIAAYYVDNYSTPLSTVRKLSFHAGKATGNPSRLLWLLVTGVDVSDRVHLTTSHVGGGGFSQYLFVEGLHYDIRPMTSTHAEVMLTLDMSPAAYYGRNPFDPRALAYAAGGLGQVAIT